MCVVDYLTTLNGEVFVDKPDEFVRVILQYSIFGPVSVLRKEFALVSSGFVLVLDAQLSL